MNNPFRRAERHAAKEAEAKKQAWEKLSEAEKEHTEIPELLEEAVLSDNLLCVASTFLALPDFCSIPESSHDEDDGDDKDKEDKRDKEGNNDKTLKSALASSRRL